MHIVAIEQNDCGFRIIVKCYKSFCIIPILLIHKGNLPKTETFWFFIHHSANVKRPFSPCVLHKETVRDRRDTTVAGEDNETQDVVRLGRWHKCFQGRD